VIFSKSTEVGNEEYNGKDGTCIQSKILEYSIVVVALSPNSSVDAAAVVSDERNNWEATPALIAVEKSPADVKNFIADTQERRVVGLDRNWHRKMVVAAMVVR